LAGHGNPVKHTKLFAEHKKHITLTNTDSKQHLYGLNELLKFNFQKRWGKDFLIEKKYVIKLRLSTEKQ